MTEEYDYKTHIQKYLELESTLNGLKRKKQEIENNLKDTHDAFCKIRNEIAGSLIDENKEYFIYNDVRYIPFIALDKVVYDKDKLDQEYLILRHHHNHEVDIGRLRNDLLSGIEVKGAEIYDNYALKKENI